MLNRLLEQRDEAVDFAGGVFIRLGRAGGVLEHRVHQNGNGLGDAIEDEQLVGDEEVDHRGLQIVVRRTRHHRLDVMNEFVADETDRPAGEPRQAGHRDGAILLHHALDRRQAVAQAGRGRRSAGPGFCLNAEGLDDLAVLKHFDGLAHLPDDRARIAAHERVAPDMLAALDRLEQEGLARPTDLAIGRKRRFNVSQQPAGDGDQVALGGQLQKLFECG